jgi:chemotaxis signal transduction protein
MVRRDTRAELPLKSLTDRPMPPDAAAYAAAQTQAGPSMSIVDDLIPHMRRVQSAERDLRDLSLLWQMIEASSAISCPEEAESILPMLTQTRVRFSALQARLVQQLGAESLAELREELASSAQCTIDILVRNLFERTADVGFLATDDVLRAFCSAAADEREAGRGAFLQRLSEYRAKYTVYDDIIVVASNGEVLARLDPSRPLTATADPIVAAALARPGFVERFAPSDLAADERPALLYAHRVDDGRGRTTGALVLRFRNADEMAQIFGSVVDPKRQLALLLLDGDDRVIASSDEIHVPVGAHVQTVSDGEVGLTVFGGREYLSVTRATNGYQGYHGPSGWRSHAMVSLLTAFRSRHEDNGQAQALSLDNEELARIQAEGDAINGDLRRVVWNGRLVAGTQAGAQARLKAVLRQINEAGTRTRDRVALAIRDLYRSSLGRARHQAHELARLAADIMDRNLYERANDCRWWALDGSLRAALEQPGEAGARKASAVLGHINGLYTVYSLLLLMDAQGRVVATSRSDAQDWIGRRLDADWVRPTLALPDHQAYARSAFQATPLYDGRHTYVYTAAVRGKGSQVLGGTAIVFDGAPQFEAMLRDTLPQASVEGAALGLFVTRSGEVVATTDARFPVGQRVPFADRLPQLARGESRDLLLELDGAVYAAGVSMSRGYREYDSSPAQHDADVSCVMLMRLYETAAAVQAPGSSGFRAGVDAQAAGERCEIASFVSGGQWLGVRAGQVQAAIDAPRITAMPGGPAYAAGVLVHEKETMVVVDLQVLRGQSAAAPRSGPLILCTSQAGMRLALWVEDLGSVFSVPAAALQGLPGYLAGIDPLAQAVFKAGEGNNGAMLTVIDVDKVAALVARQGLPLPDSAEVAGLSALSDTSLGAGLHEGSMLTAALP